MALPGSAVASYCQTPGRERVALGVDLSPRWPARPASEQEAEAQAADFGGRPIERSARSFFEFLRSHALRQYGHLIHSDSNMPELAAACREAGADAAVFGLLEAIRVEARIGISLGRVFDWTAWHGASEAQTLPEPQRPLFHWLREGRADPSRMPPDQADAWLSFHDRLVGAAGSAEVIEMSKEWVSSVFPKPEQTQDGQPQDGQSQDGQSQDGQSQDGKPQDGKPQDGQSQDGKLQDGQSQDGQPQDGQSQDGQPQDGKSQDGKSQDGKLQDGKSDDLAQAPGSSLAQSASLPESARPQPKAGEKGQSSEPGEQGAPPAKLPKERQPGKRVGAAGEADAPAVDAQGSSSGQASDKPASSPNPGEGQPVGAEGAPGSMLERILAGQGPEALDPQGSAPDSGASMVPLPSTEEAQAERGHGFSEDSGDESPVSDKDPSVWDVIPEKPDLLAGSTDLFAWHFREGAEIDEELALRARRVLERMLTGQSRAVLSDSPSKRMSIRHMAQGGDAKFIRKEDFTRGAMAIDIVVDCSGSMRGAPIAAAKALLLALSQLAAKGLVKGRAIFSSGEGWMACPLPMKTEKIARVKAFSGSEGIEPALTQNARKLREADAVFVFTDAQITDKAFCKHDLKTRKVEPLGLYVGSDSAQGKMEQYFDRHLIRPTLEDLCSAMVQRFLSQKKLVLATQVKKARLRR